MSPSLPSPSQGCLCPAVGHWPSRIPTRPPLPAQNTLAPLASCVPVTSLPRSAHKLQLTLLGPQERHENRMHPKQQAWVLSVINGKTAEKVPGKPKKRWRAVEPKAMCEGRQAGEAKARSKRPGGAQGDVWMQMLDGGILSLVPFAGLKCLVCRMILTEVMGHRAVALRRQMEGFRDETRCLRFSSGDRWEIPEQEQMGQTLTIDGSGITGTCSTMLETPLLV